MYNRKLGQSSFRWFGGNGVAVRLVHSCPAEIYLYSFAVFGTLKHVPCLPVLHIISSIGRDVHSIDALS